MPFQHIIADGASRAAQLASHDECVLCNSGPQEALLAYFEDLSDYVYRTAYSRPATKNIGWLTKGYTFAATEPTEGALDAVWDYCTVSVSQTRGLHQCEFCTERGSYRAKRKGIELLLGSSEIRVLSKRGAIYAAPTLLYHYMAIHHYRPPDEFLQVLIEEPRPPSQDYFSRLDALDLEWRMTSSPEGKAFRWVRVAEDEWVKEEFD